jgi:hypothetical protein
MTGYNDSEINIGDPAPIFYGDTAVKGTITDVRRFADKSVRMIGVRPEGVDHTAWFYAPRHELSGFVGVTGSTVAYV